MNEFAARSAEELVYLRAVVKQLDSLELRESYANWLESDDQIE